MKRYDLSRTSTCAATILLTRTAMSHLRQSAWPHVLTLSPPLNLRPEWAGRHLALSKWGMSIVALCPANELFRRRHRCESLWPRRMIATDAVRNLLGGDEVVRRSRRPEIVADAAYEILTREPSGFTGNFFIDEDVLRDTGATAKAGYLVDASAAQPELDVFVEA